MRAKYGRYLTAWMGGGRPGEAARAGPRRLAINVGAQLLARVATMAISVVTVSLTARTLGRAGYGVWSGASSFIGLFSVLIDLGFVNAATQRMAAEPEREARWLGALALALVVQTAFACLLAVGLVPLVLRETHSSRLVAAILAATLLASAAQALMAVFHSRLRAPLVLTLNVFQSLLWMVATVVLAAVHGSVVAFAGAYSGILLGVAALRLRLTSSRAEVDLRGGRALWRELAAVAVPLGIASIFISVYYQIDSVLLLELRGARETGVYGAAYNFLSPLTFLPAAVMSSFMPVIAAVKGSDPQRSRQLIGRAAELMAAIGLPVVAVGFALSGPIVSLIYGHDFHRAASLLPIVLIAFASICFGSLAGYLAPVFALQRRLAVYSAIGAILNAALNAALIPSYGATASAWITVGTELSTMALMLTAVLRRSGARLPLARLARIAALAGALAGVLIVDRPLGLFGDGALGGVLYLLGLAAAGVVPVGRLRALLAGP
jgi:O-antigen/teichoic acid export membrane protein